MQPVESCWAANFYATFKKHYFLSNSSKIKFYLQKNAKFSNAAGSAPRPQCLRRLRALPPAAEGFAPRLPKQIPSPPTDCEFLATRLNMVCKRNYPSIVLFFNNNSYIFQKPISGRVDRASVTEAVDSSSIPGRVKTKTIKIGIHSFPA